RRGALSHAAERPRQHQGGAGADKRGGKRGQERDVVGMEDPAREAEDDGRSGEGATERNQPAGTRIAPPEPGRHHEGEAGDHGEAEQPSGLAAERRLEEPKRSGGAAEQRVPAATGAAAPTAESAGAA